MRKLDYVNTPYFLEWDSKGKWTKLKYAVYVQLLHVSLKVFGFRLVHAYLNSPKNDIVLFLNSEQDLLHLKRKIERTFYRIKNSKLIICNCLSLSLFLWYILGKQGLLTELNIGAEKKAEEFSAHAWISYKGLPLNDYKENLKKYSTLVTL